VWDLAVKILGGEGANRLHRVLRSERGLTYGASADTQAMKQAGDYVAETDTETGNTGEVLRLTMEEFSRLQRQRVGARELADAQAYLAGSFPLTLETPNDLATQLLNQVFYELPVEDIRNYRERVQAITPDDIQAVAKQYILPDRLSIVLVGNAKAFIGQLKAQGFNDVEVIPIERLDLSSATLTRERAANQRPPGSFEPFGSFTLVGRPAYTASQVNPKSDVPNDPAATELLRRVVEAKGGLAALKSVRTVVVDSLSTIPLQQGAYKSLTKTYVSYPDKFRIDTTTAAGDVVMVYNAGAAWEKSPAGVREAPPAMRDDFAASVRRDLTTILIGASEGRLTARAPGDQTRPDGTRVKVLEISGPQLDPVRLFIDDRMLIAGQVYSVAGPNGRAVRSEEVMSDYRLVSGLQIAFQTRVIRAGQPVVVRTITNLAINGAVSDMLFARPQ